MARPSVKAERSEEILQAFKRCIVRYGLQDSSLERIADEANLARQILRHYVGNKDDLIVALTDRFVSESVEQLNIAGQDISAEERQEALIKVLFLTDDKKQLNNIIGNALLAESSRLPEVQRKLGVWFESLIKLVQSELKQVCPSAGKSGLRSTALALVSLAIAAESVQPIVKSSRYRRDTMEAGRALIASLKAG